MDKYDYIHGRIAFDAYVEKVGGETHDGQQIPKWEDLAEQTREGWAAAAKAAGSVALNISLRRSLEVFVDMKLPLPEGANKMTCDWLDHLNRRRAEQEASKHNIEDETHLKECNHPECISARNK